MNLFKIHIPCIRYMPNTVIVRMFTFECEKAPGSLTHNDRIFTMLIITDFAMLSIHGIPDFSMI